MSYTELTGDKSVPGSIRSWMNYKAVDAENVLIDAQGLIYQTLRVRQMKAGATLAVSSGVDFIDIPEGYLSYVSMRNVTDNTDIMHKDWEELDYMRYWTNGVLDDGDPCWFSVFEEKLQFDVKTTSAFTARMLYYKLPQNLGPTNLTNFLTTRYPHLLRPACLAMGAVFFKDNESYSREMQRLSALVSGANVQADLDDHAGQDIQIIGP